MIRRCDDAMRIIRYISGLCTQYKQILVNPEDGNSLFRNLDSYISCKGKNPMAYFEECEQLLIVSEKFLAAQQREAEKCYSTYHEVLRHKEVLKRAVKILLAREKEYSLVLTLFWNRSGDIEQSGELSEHLIDRDMKFSYMAGVVSTEDSHRLKKLLFRRIRGNALIFLQDLGTEYIGKSLFLVAFREMELIHKTIQRVCEVFTNEVYEITKESRKQEMALLEKEINMKSLYEGIKSNICKKLADFSSIQGRMGSYLVNVKWFVEREKTIYNTLNMFKLREGLFKGYCWCPINKKEEVNKAINNLQESKKVLCSNLTLLPKEHLMPPTNFRCNDFMRPFQEIVYTYGVPSYREANPTLFTIVTFPFLFGIMFGDFAHGLVLLSLSLYVCFKKDSLVKSNSLLSMMVPYRYLILLMSIFSAFCGFLYNDFAAVPLNFVPTCFDKQIGKTDVFNRTDTNCTYPIGFDPKWYSAVNELQFINSFKMKVSVIVGILQMLMGVVLKGLNSLDEKKPIDFWFEFIPQLLFMVSYFGYMIIMIVVKWLSNWEFIDQNGPSIITLLIGIPLKGSDPGPIPLYGDGSFQQFIGQTIFCIY
jgi:V-type H+-transporting ATPase subunit a